jgi:hypothetical protein
MLLPFIATLGRVVEFHGVFQNVYQSRFVESKRNNVTFEHQQGVTRHTVENLCAMHWQHEHIANDKRSEGFNALKILVTGFEI